MKFFSHEVFFNPISKIKKLRETRSKDFNLLIKMQRTEIMKRTDRIENISTANGKYSQSGIPNTNYKMLVFKSDLFINQNLRIVNNVDKKPYFMASDIAKILLYKNIDSMAKYLVKDNDKFQYKDTRFYNSSLGLGLQPHSIFINLNGFNDILLRTKSKNAKSVKKWLESEILPCFEKFYMDIEEEDGSEETKEGNNEEDEEEEDDNEETKDDNEETKDDNEETKDDNGTQDEKKIFKVVLRNNQTINIDIREDGYVDVTQLCKAGGKSFVDYQKLKQNQGYAEATSSYLGIPVSELIDIKLYCTYAHPKVACNVAKWISSDFEEQILDFFEESENKNNEHNEIPEFRDFKLTLSDGKEFSIPVRKDGYINVTLLCRSANKRIDKWKERKESKALIEAFKVIPQNRGITPLASIKGQHSTNLIQGTFAHPDIAIQIAQWCSPSFAIQVSRWTRELLLTGKVELGKEKSNEELENVYKEKLSEMENQLESTKNELSVLSKTHNSMLRRQKRTPYEIGSVVYLISHEAFTGFYNTDYFKVGEATQKSGEDHSAFVKRLSGYNTSAPVNFKVNFLIYVEENQLLEQNTLTRFRKNLNPCNKEWIKSVDFKTITEYMVNMCELMNVEYKIVVNDPIVQNMESMENVSESISGVEEINEEENENEEEDEEIEEINQEDTEEEIEIEAEQERKKLNGKFECMICHECNISDKRAMNCVSCSRQLSRKVKERPTHGQLLKDVERMSIVDVGKKYGVSDNCIRKWIRNS